METPNKHKLTDNKYLKFSEDKRIITVVHPKLPKFRLVKVKGGEGIIEKLNKKTKVANFYMAEHQVTQELYQAVTDKNPSEFKGKRRPVEQVNWYSSVQFCRDLSTILNLPQAINNNTDKAELDISKPGFRLPTEAEWEYAARGANANTQNSASQKHKYAGTNYLHQVGWYDANNDFETRPVGLKLPNALGLYDMSGNVWEWCWDWHDSSKKYRVLRGGSWINYAVNGRVAYRYNSTPDYDWIFNGFRLVLSSIS